MTRYTAALDQCPFRPAPPRFSIPLRRTNVLSKPRAKKEKPALLWGNENRYLFLIIFFEMQWNDIFTFFFLMLLFDFIVF